MVTPSDLIVIYNANGTALGKLTYAWNKIKSSSKDEPACAACDITHGGLSLNEVPGWKVVKDEIERNGTRVVQWHRDEVDDVVREWVKANDVRYPVVLRRTSDKIELVADSGELAGCAGDANKLLDLLKKKGFVEGNAQPSL